MGGRALPAASSKFSAYSTNYSTTVEFTVQLLGCIQYIVPSLQPRNPHDDRLVLNKHGSIYPQDTEVSGNNYNRTISPNLVRSAAGLAPSSLPPSSYR